MHESLNGIVTRSQSGFFTVMTPEGEFICRLRGRLKIGKKVGDVVAVGDQVNILLTSGNEGIVDEVLPRKSMIIRKAPRPQGEYQQILIANPDQIVIVFACANPKPRFSMLDRFLVMSEKQKVPALIIANKIDLIDEATASQMFEVYTCLGYSCVLTSAYTGVGIEELRSQLTNKITIFTGPSGAGKTSLLNAIQPELGLAVRSVSLATSKGRHTTVVREMFALESGGFVVDTPGLKALALWDIEPEEVDGYFRELAKLVEFCQFNDCKHVNEPGCAVIDAVQQGEIAPERYQSYLKIRFGKSA